MDNVNDFTEYLQRIRVNIQGSVGRVQGQEAKSGAEHQAFNGELSINGRNNDIAVFRFFSKVHNQLIIVANAALIMELPSALTK